MLYYDIMIYIESVHLVFFVFVYAVKENSLIVVVHVSFTCVCTHTHRFLLFSNMYLSLSNLQVD